MLLYQGIIEILTVWKLLLTVCQCLSTLYFYISR